MRNGHVFRRQMWAPAIGGIGGGALPAPKAGDGERGRDNARARPDTKGWELATVVRDQMLPTPVARDDGKTPEAHLAMKARMKGGPRSTITSLAVLARAGMQQPSQLPTPTTNDSKNASLPPSQQDRDGLAGAMLRNDSIPTGAATYLNPSFVEEMMGYSIGWTVCEP